MRYEFSSLHSLADYLAMQGERELGAIRENTSKKKAEQVRLQAHIWQCAADIVRITTINPPKK